MPVTLSVSRRLIWAGSLTSLGLALQVGFLAVHLSPPKHAAEPSRIPELHLMALQVTFPVTVLAAALLLTLYHLKVQRDLRRHEAQRQRDAHARETVLLLAQRQMGAEDLGQFMAQVTPLLASRLNAAVVELRLGELCARHGDAEGDTHGLYTAPIEVDGEAVGRLDIGGLGEQAHDPAFQEGMVLITSYLASAIQRLRATEDLRRARDAALESARLKSEFLATMSHEIRTPLHGTIGMNALLLDTDLTLEQREYAETVRRSSEHLLSLLNDILDLSKIEADRLELERIEFDLERVVREAVSFLLEPAQQKGLQLTCYLHSGLPGTVVGDPGRLRQVLLNLVGNAVKFTDHGRIEVRARLTTQADGTSTVRFEVSDTGPGVPAHVQERLFQPFSQADSSTTRRHGGSGLGLAISRRLVGLMGGEIGVTSDAGRGSRFWFTTRFDVRAAHRRITSTRVSALRLLAPRAEHVTRGVQTDEVAQADAIEPAVGPLVLVAEDNKVNQRLAVRMLEKLGYRAHVVENGQEAIDALEANDYACVLMDCQMPGVDGYEATARIRAGRTRRARTPIIALTASAMQGDRERCLGVGMDEHITKPVRLEVLRSTLDDLLGEAAWCPATRALTTT